MIVDRALSPFVRLGADGYITGAGGSVVELLGRTPEDLCGRWMLELLHPDSHDAVIEAFQSASDVDRVSSPRWVSSGLIVDLIDVDGETVACDLAVDTSNRTGLPGFVIQLRRAGVTVALRQTVKAMGADEPLDDVLRSVARVLEMSLAASLVEVAYDVTADGFATSAGASPFLPADDGGPGDRPWVESARSNQACRLETLDELPERVRGAAEAKGPVGCSSTPSARRRSDGRWGRCSPGCDGPRQRSSTGTPCRMQRSLLPSRCSGTRGGAPSGGQQDTTS